MVKKIHLVNKKKGMTLVEMMASLAILLILFGGITSMILTNMKAEIKSNTRIENISYIKAIMAMFEVNAKVENITDESGAITTTVSEYIPDSVFKDKLLNKPGVKFTFNSIGELKEILSSETGMNSSGNSDNKTYRAYIEVKNATKGASDISNLYEVYVRVENILKGEITEKTLYINRVNN